MVIALTICATVVIVTLSLLIGLFGHMLVTSHKREIEALQELASRAMGYIRAKDLHEVSQHLLDQKYVNVVAQNMAQPAVPVSQPKAHEEELEFVTLEDGRSVPLGQLEPL